MKWDMMATLNLTATRADGRTISIAMIPAPSEGWIGVASESNFDGTRPMSEQIARTLDSHGHCQLPVKPSLAKAIEQAEKYVRWWQRSRATQEDCPCEELSAP